MVVVALPHGSPKSIFSNLARIPLSSAKGTWGLDRSNLADLCLGDLTDKDHLVMLVSSKSLFAKHQGLRCNVSVVAAEPPAVQQRYYHMIPILANRFHSIFTYSSKLSRLGNAKYLAHGGCSFAKNAAIGNKIGGISLVASTKTTTTGQRLRHSIAQWALAENSQLQLFGRAYRPVSCVSEALAPFHFSFVIENSKYDGYFTEKLIDCFCCRTVPIYWGDPSIQNVFDPRGMILCNHPRELIDAAMAVDASLYQKMLPFLEENRLRARRYLNSMLTRAAVTLFAHADESRALVA